MTQAVESMEQSGDGALVAETSARRAGRRSSASAQAEEAPPTPAAPHPPKSPSPATAAGLSALEGLGEFEPRSAVGPSGQGVESDMRGRKETETTGAGTGEGIDGLIDERGKTHGDFDEVAEIAQAIKGWLRKGSAWSRLTPVQREALESKATKDARIVCGDPNFPDHWRDDAGYTALVIERLPAP